MALEIITLEDLERFGDKLTETLKSILIVFSVYIRLGLLPAIKQLNISM